MNYTMETNGTNLPEGFTNAWSSEYRRFLNIYQETLNGIITRRVETKDTIRDWWLGPGGDIYEGGGAPTYDKLAQHENQVKLSRWTARGFSFDRQEYISTNIPQYADEMRRILDRFAALPVKQVVKAIENGHNVKAWDDVNYFNATASGKRKQGNILVGGGTTQDQISEDIKKLELAFSKIKNERNQDTDVMFDTILIPQELRHTFRVVLNSTGSLDDNKNSGVINPLGPIFGDNYTVITSRYLGDTDDWYAFDSRYSPMYWFTQLQPMPRGGAPVQVRTITSDKLEEEDYIGFSARMWGGVAYGHPFSAYKVTN